MGQDAAQGVVARCGNRCSAAPRIAAGDDAGDRFLFAQRQPRFRVMSGGVNGCIWKGLTRRLGQLLNDVRCLRQSVAVAGGWRNLPRRGAA